MPGLFDLLNEIGDLQALITDAVRESEVLEYKTANAKFADADRVELVKDVSAMANAGGGVLVYGIATDGPVDKTKPVTIQPIHLANIETFDRVVNSQIKPPIRGIPKKLIPRDAPQVMVIDVPESDNPPHQNLYDKNIIGVLVLNPCLWNMIWSPCILAGRPDRF